MATPPALCPICHRPAEECWETGALTRALVDFTLCLACVSLKSGVPHAEMLAVIARLQSHLTVIEKSGQCDSCGTTTVAFALG